MPTSPSLPPMFWPASWLADEPEAPTPALAVPVGIRPTPIDRARWQRAALAHSLRTVGLVHRVGEWVS